MGFTDFKINITEITHIENANTTNSTQSFIGWCKDNLHVPKTIALRYKEYADKSKNDQLSIKNTRAYSFSQFQGNSRKSRDLITKTGIVLDLDHADSDTIDNLKTIAKKYTYVLHSTLSHNEDIAKFRYRLIIPTCENISPEDYSQQAQQAALDFGVIDAVDTTTFTTARFMYYPTKCKDIDYVYVSNAGVTYRAIDMTEANTVQLQQAQVKVHCKTKPLRMDLPDPTQKNNLIGQWCREYNVAQALEVHLSDFYKKTNDPKRYSYIHSTTEGGLVVYDDNSYCYSHHETDPAGDGHTHNAYDIVRIHKFKGSEDMMRTYVNNLLNKDAITNMFQEMDSGDIPDLEDWESELRLTVKGHMKKEEFNLALIMKNKYKVTYDDFTQKVFIQGKALSDGNLIHMRDSITELKGVEFSKTSMLTVLGAVQEHYSSLVDTLEALPKWDGVARLETVFLDYFEVIDNSLNREIATKFFIAAVQRAYKPGQPFQLVPILQGKQGCGKSQFARIISLDKSKYNVSKVSRFGELDFTLQGKEQCEKTFGKWIIELAEMSGFRKADQNKMKAFFTSTEQQYRKPYSIETVSIPHSFVCIATTNDSEFLRDLTGNRRFAVIECKAEKMDRKKLKENIEQIWAEALQIYKANPNQFMELSEQAAIERDTVALAHVTQLTYEEDIIEILNTLVDKDRYLKTYDSLNIGQEKEYPDRICMDELAVHLSMSHKKNDFSFTRSMNQVMSKLGWVKKAGRFYVGKSAKRGWFKA
tara:strand:- start:1114 stop:3384 length:2271 start_codon:yes stop_codon:yes gene_type:complete